MSHPTGGTPPPHGGGAPPPHGGGAPPSGYPPQGGGYPPSGYPPQGGGAPPHGGGAPPQGGGAPHGGAPPPQGGGYPPSGYPPQGGGGYPPSGYPPQGYPPSGYPPQGYPPSGYPPSGYPPSGYPPQGYPQGGGYPPQGYPPQGGGGAPPHGGGAPPQKWSPSGGGAPPPPATAFNNSWFGALYQQINQNEMVDIQKWFASVDADRSGTVSAMELASITFNGAPLGPVAAQKLLNVFDKDRSGNISFHEYAALHKFLTILQNAWFQADRDRSGRLDANEIQTALGVAGFQLSVPTVKGLMFNYDKTGYGLTFPDFLMVCATAAQVKSVFEIKDSSKSGTLHLNYEQVVELASLLQ